MRFFRVLKIMSSGPTEAKVEYFAPSMVEAELSGSELSVAGGLSRPVCVHRLSSHGTPGRSALTLISGRPLEPAEEGCSSPELRLRRTPATQPDRQLTPQQQENRPPAQQQQQQSPFRSAQPRVQSPERLPTPRPLQERLPPPPQQQLQPPPPALPQCRPVARQLSDAEVENVWCNVLLGR